MLRREPATVSRSVLITASQKCILGFILDLYRAKFRHVFLTGKTKAAAGASPRLAATPPATGIGVASSDDLTTAVISLFQTRGRSNRTPVSAGGRFDEVKALLVGGP